MTDHEARDADQEEPADERTDGGIPLDITGTEAADGAITAAPTTLPGGNGGGGGGPDGNGSGGGDAVEPVEVLVQMADDGEIDPWDIDIVAVTDEFLARLDDADLRTGGRALFYASVLLRMKSDAMLEDGSEETWAEEAWDAPMDDPRHEGPAVDPFDALEDEMDRRLDRKHARGTPRTLDELVRELRERERATRWKQSRSYDTSDSPSGFARGAQELSYHDSDDLRMADEPTEADAFERTHGEHMEDVINDVYVTLQEQYEAGREEVLYAEIDGAGGSRVETYLGVLFLAHRGQVRLEQDELFGDLWIRDPAAVSADEPVEPPAA